MGDQAYSSMSFVDYLAAKKSVDDRALNRQVWQTLLSHLPLQQQRPLRWLEVGMGIGTMVERMVAWGGLGETAVYHGIDLDAANVAVAEQRLRQLPVNMTYQLETIDAFAFAERERGRQHWDVLVAHAFLDLVDIPTALPQLLALVPDGLFYFTLNFDGATILQPTIEPELDRQIEQLYHQTMDERLTGGRPSGDSQTGRHLFHQLQAAGGHILAAGSSDWVVWAGEEGYSEAEADFLHFIIETMYGALRTHPDLETAVLAQWIQQRHAQIERGELIYIAHQLDFVGHVS